MPEASHGSAQVAETTFGDLVDFVDIPGEPLGDQGENRNPQKGLKMAPQIHF